jgi:putative two-component system response regulator
MSILNLLRPNTDAQVPAATPARAVPEPSVNTSHLDGQIDPKKTSKVMIVDDEAINVRIVRKYLEHSGYEQFVTVTDSRNAMPTILSETPDIVLLDIMMPEVNGLDILHSIRTDESVRDLPVIILTAASDTGTKLEALDLGATDFLTKPVDQVELVLRVRNALIVKGHMDDLANYSEHLESQVRARTRELERSRQEIIHCLARAADYRDGDTGQHIVRVGRFVRIIARELGFQPDYVDLLEQAAKLHDVGKIGIPDAVLQKPGKLDANEFALMQNHCDFGKEIIQLTPNDADDLPSAEMVGTQCILDILRREGSPLLTLAALIAQTHHEKWDGSGYPCGLQGEEIPIEGRITAVADVFDALSSKRPYKPAFPLKKCFEIMLEGRGKHFDPSVLDVFFAHAREVVAIRQELVD